jgi:hypothetical protein
MLRGTSRKTRLSNGQCGDFVKKDSALKNILKKKKPTSLKIGF